MIEKKSFQKILYLAMVSLLVCTRMHADTFWTGGNQSGNVTISPGNSLDISNSNFLTTPVSIINSSGAQAFVNIVADAIVSSSQELYFYVSLGSITTVSVVNDLLFTGSNGEFLITVSGGGLLEFNVFSGETLSFNTTPTMMGNPGGCITGNIGGAAGCTGNSSILTGTLSNGAILLNDMTSGVPSTILFQPGTTLLTANATVEVGLNSAISFLGNAPGQTGFINFDASIDPASIGRFILKIDNGGSVVNEAASLTGLPVTLQNIQFNVGSGFGSPVINIVNNNFPSGFNGLLIVNGNTTWAGLENNPFCELMPTSTLVIRKGFILGAGSVLNVPAETYIDYVVTVTNITVNTNIPSNVLNQPCQRFPTRVIKDRNPAALIVDGNSDNSNPARINMIGNSAIYFRSGVDCLGNSCMFTGTSMLISFTINPAADLKTEGTIVLEVEGPLIVNGNSDAAETIGTAFQILSWQVAPIGGSVLINQSDVNFPLRTFAQDTNGNYLQYGSAYFFINNKMQLVDMHLQNTDEIHNIYEDNVAGDSSPCYVGGDRLNICCSTNTSCPCYAARVTPAIQFYNSFFDLHTSAAVVGLSLQVVNDSDIIPTLTSNNITQFVFYGNGRCIDNGTGRSLILGTEVGSEASDFQTIVNRNAQLDIMQSNSLINSTIDLLVSVSYNNFKVTPGIVGNITGQLGVNTIFLAYASNISIGTQDATFLGTSTPSLIINGEFFSFMSQGGDLNSPQSSGTTGQGGMFVDLNGIVTAVNNRANFGMMVTKSLNGIVNLPINQVFFDPRVGIAQWKLNLNDPLQLVIVGPGVQYSDYTIDWQNLMKDYCNANPQLFIPYEPTTAPFVPATLYPVSANNLIGLPTILGSVDQLQVINSRLGDQVHLMIDGSADGEVREFVFLTGSASATAPVGVLALQNNALIGLGTASRNVDSLDASVVLGINGVILMPNGDATVRLNVDTLINNYCHIVTGTLFGDALSSPTGNRLLITSVVPKELRIKTGGVLDLTQFTSTLQTLVIGGQVNMVLEPGAEVILGGGNLIFAGDSSCVCEPDTAVNVPAGTDVTSTNEMRVRLTGSGRVTFKENSRFVVSRGSLVGIESAQITGVSDVVNQSWAFTDNATFNIGSSSEFGGGFQIGNTNSVSEGSPLINFTLVLTGVGALLDIDSQGFMGLGVGIVNKPPTAPNTWLVGSLFNVNSITLTIPEGTLQNNQTYSGDATISNLAGLLAIANSQTAYSFNFDPVNADILGGGNMVLVSGSPTAVAPIVQNIAGVTVPGVITAGIMSSKATLLDYPKSILAPTIVNATGFNFFNYLSMNEYSTQAGKTATIFRNRLAETTIGFVLNTAGVNLIRRDAAGQVRGLNGVYVNPNNSLTIGAVGVAVDLTTGAAELSQLNPEQ